MLEIVLDRDDLASLDVAERRLALRGLLGSHGAVEMLPEIADRIDGFGPLSPLMSDPSVTDVLVNRHDEVWIERDGVLQPTTVTFGDVDELLDFVERMLGAAGRRADASHPVEDARLPDGSRMHVVMPPLAGSEPVVSIRLFPRAALTLEDLEKTGTLTERQASTLRALVRDRRSILVAGATGAGKTTLLNALLRTIPSHERVVTIEETAELHRMDGHHVALVARNHNAEGRGAVSLDDLLRAALRMRPDRIVVGEVRGSEAAVAVDAMSTGHEGSLLTIHAAGTAGALDRLRNLASRTGTDPAAIAERIQAAVHAVVFMRREGRGRRVSEITET